MLTSKQANQALERVLSSTTLPKMGKRDESKFLQRLAEHFPPLVSKMYELYGDQYDFFYHLQKLVLVLANAYAKRKPALKRRDAERLAEPRWFRHERMLGMAVYVDLFAGDLEKLRARIPYLQELGVNYLHLMPLYLSPEGDSDGGYAVSDYRKVNPALGDEKALVALSDDLRAAGISMVLDFVFNHTSDEHRWAKAAREGDPEFEGYYYFFEDKKDVDEYNQTCREIFPAVRRGSFTFLEDKQQWVWTTFNSFQWDLNYKNPAVFNAITDEMLFLANIGAEALRLDALAFVWKEKWTQCESLPKAHTLIQCFAHCLKIVAPSTLFKSEAIVHPDEVAEYIRQDECELSYNPLLMALMWETLATRKTALLNESMKKSFAISPDCSWVNYIRCHDDIGWTFDDSVASHLGIHGYDHRLFLNQFYTGKFVGSFANGVPFQANPTTGDCRVCGSLAALTGVDGAVATGDDNARELALKRVNLLNAIICSIGGIPLLYQGDELGMANDFSYLDDPHKKNDARWVNRPRISDDDIANAKVHGSVANRVNRDLRKLIALRNQTPALGEAETQILDTYRESLFAFCRHHANGEKVLVIANFSEDEVSIPSSICDILGSRKVHDMISGNTYCQPNITLGSYDVVWLITTE